MGMFIRGYEIGSPAVVVLAAVAVAALVVAVGPVVIVGALGGVTIAGAILLSPVVGVVLTIFANTSFQVLGSSHFTGLPASASQLLTLLTLGGWLLHVLLRRSGFAPSAQWRWLLAILSMIILWDLFLTENPAPMAGAARFLTVLVLFVVIANAVTKERDIIGVVGALTGAMAVCGTIGIAEHFLPSLAVESDSPALAEGTIGAILDVSSLEGVVLKRITGGLGDANWLAYSIVAVMPLSLYLWERFRTPLARCLVGLLIALQLAGLVLSYTRTGFLGLGVAMIYLILRRTLPFRYVLLGAIALGIAALMYMPPGLVDRFFSSSYLKEGSTPLREMLVTRAASIWLESPIVGHGYSGFGSQIFPSLRTDPLREDPLVRGWMDDLLRAIDEKREQKENIGTHNLYLEILVEYGLIGFSLFAGLVIAMFRDLSWIERNGRGDQRLLAICIKAGMLAFLTCGMLGHAKYLKVPWMLAGLTVACRAVVTRQQRIIDGRAYVVRPVGAHDLAAS